MHIVKTSNSRIQTLRLGCTVSQSHTHTSDADGITFADPAITEANRKRPPIPKE